MPGSLKPGEVFAYDATGNHLVPTPVAVGDDVEWKRNGMTGSLVARVVEIGPEKIKIRPLRHKGRGDNLMYARAIWVGKQVMRVIGSALQNLTEEQVQVSESIHGTYYYHVSLKSKPSVALCGATAMPTGVPLSTWGCRGHLQESYCRSCEAIGRDGGLSLTPAAPITSRAAKPG